MTKLFLAAGVAALAISASAAAQGGPHGDKGGQAAQAQQRGGGNPARAAPAQRAAQTERMAQRAQRVAMPRAERTQRFAAVPERRPAAVNRAERRVMVANNRPARVERMQARIADRQVRANPVNRQARMVDRQQMRTNRMNQAQTRIADRQAMRQNGVNRVRPQAMARNQIRTDRLVQAQNRMGPAQGNMVVQDRMAARANLRSQRAVAFRNAATTFPMTYANGRGNGLIDGCPPGLWMKNNGCLPPGQAAKLIGAPIATASAISALSALPQSAQYLYPDTSNYYYRYGDGYLYQVDRSSNLIDSLLPLIAGGYVPGQYLPSNYMNSYVPDYYGMNSFYPASSSNGCNRYVDGVVYQVDCYTGMIEGVVPLYASGYGIGQMLPSAYSYYNVPSQYRSMYYDTADYGYRYAPGAIYQYDQQSNLITSVAALLSPGFSVGQQLPAGYGMYNVPMDYRSTYYDTPNSWYRYNNGNIYQVDPSTQLVTAVVASLLT